MLSALFDHKGPAHSHCTNRNCLLITELGSACRFATQSPRIACHYLPSNFGAPCSRHLRSLGVYRNDTFSTVYHAEPYTLTVSP